MVVVAPVYWWYARRSQSGSSGEILERARSLVQQKAYAEAMGLLSGLVEDLGTPEEIRNASVEELHACQRKLVEKELDLGGKLAERARQDLMESAEQLSAAGAYYRGLILLEGDHAEEARRIFAAILVLFPETHWAEKSKEHLKALDLTAGVAVDSRPASP